MENRLKLNNLGGNHWHRALFRGFTVPVIANRSKNKINEMLILLNEMPKVINETRKTSYKTRKREERRGGI